MSILSTKTRMAGHPGAVVSRGQQQKDAHSAYLAHRHFGSLDGLRAFSVAGTVWHHTTVGIGWVAPTWFGARIFSAGSLGVQMFFAISGFLITTLLLREHSRTGRLDLKAFYRRRVLRIFPAYYLTIAIYILLAVTLFAWSSESQRFIGYLPSFLSYTENWFVPARAGETLFVQAWSLSTEEQFYLVWPVLLGLTLSRRRGLKLAGIAACSLALVRLTAGAVMNPSSLTTVLTSLALPICGGAGLAIALHSSRGFRWLGPALRQRWSATAAVGILLLMVMLGERGELIEMWLVVIVGACVVTEDHALRRVLACRPIAYVGQVSYGIYLYHLIVLWLVTLYLGVPSGPALFVAVLLLTTWAAAVSYRFFEAPFLRLKARTTQETAAMVPALQSSSAA